MNASMIFSLLGGLGLFLFGIKSMGDGLEQAAGSRMKKLLEVLTRNKLLAVLVGALITGVIQSSSATTVMVVGFVNAGLLELGRAIGVIMGANIGTTVTSLMLSVELDFAIVFTAVGAICQLAGNRTGFKLFGQITMGLGILFVGMDTMTAAMAPLREWEAFRTMMATATNPIVGVLVGAAVTALLQSSSASVGILQALAASGSISLEASLFILFGQNIGTCVTALMASVGTSRTAKRAAVVHLLFNVIGTTICLALYLLIDKLFSPAILDQSAAYLGISVCHTLFNVVCTVVLLPSGNLLEKLVCFLVPDAKEPETVSILDERLLGTPSIALERCHILAGEMADNAAQTLRAAIACLRSYDPALAQKVREGEAQADKYEDILGTYLVKLSAQQLGDNESAEAAMLLKAIGDFERISDHSVGLLCSVEELKQKGAVFSESAQKELEVMVCAVEEILTLSMDAFRGSSVNTAKTVEPLEQVIDELKDQLRTRHILRLQQGSCSIETGFVWTDLIHSLERSSDHCSSIASGIIDLNNHDRNTHQMLRSARTGSDSYRKLYQHYISEYTL